MEKHKKPLKSPFHELFDADMTYDQRVTLREEYRRFWETLDLQTQVELDRLLM